jgi:hypothetical protein
VRGPDTPLRRGHRHLGTVEVPAGGEIERRFELKEDFPARLALHLRNQGEPLIGVKVSLFDTRRPAFEQAVGLSGVDGSVALPPIFPGRKQVLVQALDAGWAYLVPEPVEVWSGQALEKALEVPVYEGRVHCVRASDGRSLARFPMWLVPLIQHPGFEARGRLHFLENDGTLFQELPPGRYSFRSVDHPDGPSSEEPDSPDLILTWTRNGPEPARWTVEVR